MLIFKTIISFWHDKEYRILFVSTNIILLIGTIAYHFIEKWSWVDSMYFSVITLTTIGYGDISPQTDGGKIFTIVYILVGLGIILSFIQTVYDHYYETRNSMKEKPLE